MRLEIKFNINIYLDFYDIYYTNVKNERSGKKNFSQMSKKKLVIFSVRETKKIPSRK